MGGPWRERGFDPAELKSPRPWTKRHTAAVAKHEEGPALNRLILAYILAVAGSFGLLVTLLQGGW